MVYLDCYPEGRDRVGDMVSDGENVYLVEVDAGLFFSLPTVLEAPSLPWQKSERGIGSIALSRDAKVSGARWNRMRERSCRVLGYSIEPTPRCPQDRNGSELDVPFQCVGV